MGSSERKIKVAIVVNDFLVGGIQRLYVDILSRLDRERFDVSLITLFEFEGRDTFYDLLPNDIEVYRHRFSGAKDVRAWISFIKTLRNTRPDVVISNLFLSNFITRILKPFFGYKCIAVEHNTYIYKTRSEVFWDKLLSYITFSIVAVSNSVKEFTARQEHIPLSKFTVIPNGIDISAIEEKLHSYDRTKILDELGKGKRYIINVARLTTQKNHKLLIAGFAFFAKNNDTHDLLIVGGGGLFPHLQKQIEDLGLSKRIHLLGSKKDVFGYYAVSDFFVSTSVIEGFGIAHAEALACGLPLLSTKTAGPDEMITEGENGFFIHESTPEAVASGMEKMILHNEEMKPNTKNTAARYDIKKTVNSYERLIEESVSIIA